MMMESLEAGGLEAAYSNERTEWINERSGDATLPRPYFPNDNYYELTPAEYRSSDFPYIYEGKTVKLLWGGITVVRPKKQDKEGYRVVFMRRSKAAIEESMIKAFNYTHDVVASPGFQDHMDRIVEMLRDRKSFVSVDELWYGDVVANPIKAFTQLKEAGWPIDPEKAAMIPNKKKMRSAA